MDQVLLAAPRSFCAGVEMAIKALAWMVRLFEPPVYCYHEIVHNQIVVERFRRAGVVFVDRVEDVPPGAPLMLSAHGSAPAVVRAAHERSPLVVDAACPLVSKVHHEVRRRADEGYTIVYAGHPAHDEAVGTLAVAPEAARLVESPDDVLALDGNGGSADRVAFLAQTTLALDDWEDVLAATRDRFGDVWVPPLQDLCFATTNRQAAVKALAPRCDAMVVVGSASSSNTRALEKVARATAAASTPVVRVDGPDELPAGLQGVVGVSAGASAPEDAVQQVVARLAPRQGVELVDVTTEEEYFPPPRELRDLVRTAGADHALDDDRTIAASDVLDDLGRAAGKRRLTEAFATSAELVDQHMARLVDEEIDDPGLRNALGYHLGWLDERFERVGPAGPRPGGKKLRATLAVLAYQAAAADVGRDGAEQLLPFTTAGDVGPEGVATVVPFAAAVELAHNWSLVHDDVFDRDRTRRGRPTLWTVCGDAAAIDAGDCLHALAFRALAGLADHGVAASLAAALTGELARAAVELTEGQLRDLAFETTTHVDHDRYLEMVQGKTGALMRCASYGGALLGAGGDRDVARSFGDFGLALGLAFQARDDVLGVWGRHAETGKPTGADIRRRKKSLPIVLALERASAPDGERLHRLYASRSPLVPADERDVREVLDRCGAQRLAQAQAERHRVDAGAALASRSGPAVDALRALAHLATHRTH